jgi:hypothetical protein
MQQATPADGSGGISSSSVPTLPQTEVAKLVHALWGEMHAVGGCMRAVLGTVVSQYVCGEGHPVPMLDS